MPTEPPVRELLTRHLGRRLWVYEEVASTNDVAATLAPGEAVMARAQTAGRGQYGRVWQSRPGAGLLLSVRLDPPAELRRPVLLTALVAVAVAEAVERLAGVSPALKWPNDLLLDGRKVCGILIEQRTALVAGVGLNLVGGPAEFAAAGLPQATALSQFAAPVPADQASEAVLTALDENYHQLLIDPSRLEADWRGRLGLDGRIVVAERHDGSTEVGRLEAVGFDRLAVRTAAGLVELAPERVRQLRAA